MESHTPDQIQKANEHKDLKIADELQGMLDLKYEAFKKLEKKWKESTIGMNSVPSFEDDRHVKGTEIRDEVGDILLYDITN